ncbi:MAG: gluzincin family metallopeptidase [Planctomycetota bacterium]
MIRNFALISVIAIFCLSGCLEERAQVRTVQTGGIDTPAGMIEYLRRRNLPTLKSVQVWENQYGPGLKITTAHYDIFTTLLEPLMLSQVPGYIESAYRGYQNQLPKPVATKTRFTIYLFGQRREWEKFSETFAGPAAPVYKKIKAGAYYLNGACVVYDIGRERTFSVLGHEGWHQFNSRHFKFRLPSWLDEGIAMLFEANRYEKGLFYFEPALNTGRLGALKAMLIKDKLIPLRELIALNPGEVLISDETEAVSAFYSQSYALVRFLREQNYGRWLPNYHQLLMDGLKGNWSLSEPYRTIAADRNIRLTVRWNRAVGSQLFEQYVDNDFGRIEKEYVTFCRKIVYHVHFK